MSGNHNMHLTVRNTRPGDIEKIVSLQQASFPVLARHNNIWRPEELKSHLKVFPQGQLVAVEDDGTIVGSASTLVVTLDPEYAEHTWKGITAEGMFTNHNPSGDSLYGADISTHPKFRHEGIGSMLYGARKEIAIRLGLRRMISGGRLFNYCDFADKMSALEYAQKVIKGELHDPVLSFELDNGFKFIRVLPDYMDDPRSDNFASFIEWLDPQYKLSHNSK
ncbi:MAG TPA: GNAT family N-acetyltransferase [Nitrososphaeraceae archaeon]|nr:GNAT family N-acetyltransferase [Nitrososphaeraceae archaeon]